MYINQRLRKKTYYHRNKITISVITLIIFLIPSITCANVNKIFLGNIDNTPPSILPVPQSGTQLSNSAVLWSTHDGTSFFGINFANNRTYKSLDGITWNTTSSAVGLKEGIVSYTSDGLIGSHSDATNFIIRKSTDGGNTYTSVLTQADSDARNTELPSIEKLGNRWYIAAKLGTNQIKYSDDNGSTWNTADTGNTFCGNGPAGIATYGTTIVIGTHYQTTPTCTEAIRVSTDNGTTWSNVSPNCTPSSGERVMLSPINVGGTFYMLIRGSSGAGCIVSSSDGTTWSEWADLPFSNAGIGKGVLGSFYDNANYYLYLVSPDPSDSNKLKVWYTPVSSVSWTMIYDTGLTGIDNIGNMISYNNKLYFGAFDSPSTNYYFRLD